MHSDKEPPSSGHVPDEEQKRLVGEIEPLLGYLAVVARNLMADDKAGIEAASDLVQLTVVTALDNIGKGQGPRGAERALKPWLRGIMLNIRRQLWRKNQATRGVASDDICDDTSSPSSKASREELLARMTQARSRLDGQDHQMLDWKHHDQLTLQEIGDRLGMSAAGAHKAYHRALERLEDAFLEIAATAAYRQTRGRIRSAHQGEDP